MNVTVDIVDHATPRLRRLMASISNRAPLNAEIGIAVERQVVRHLRTVKVPQGNHLGAPSTGFWLKAASSVYSRADGRLARISIPQRGVALQYFGGVVRKKDKMLTVSIDELSHGRTAAEFPGIFKIKSKKGNLLLVIRIGKGKSARLEPLYVLKDEVTIKPHPDVLPTEAQIAATALGQAETYFARIGEGSGT